MLALSRPQDGQGKENQSPIAVGFEVFAKPAATIHAMVGWVHSMSDLLLREPRYRGTGSQRLPIFSQGKQW